MTYNIVFFTQCFLNNFINFYNLDFLIFNCVYMHVCVWACAHECRTNGGQKGPDPLELELQEKWASWHGGGNWTHFLCKVTMHSQPLILHRSYNRFLSWNTLEIFELSDMVTHVRWYKFKLAVIFFNNWQHPIKEWMNFNLGNIWERKTVQTFSNHIKHSPTIDQNMKTAEVEWW